MMISQGGGTLEEELYLLALQGAVHKWMLVLEGVQSFARHLGVPTQSLPTSSVQRGEGDMVNCTSATTAVYPSEEVASDCVATDASQADSFPHISVDAPAITPRNAVSRSDRAAVTECGKLSYVEVANAALEVLCRAAAGACEFLVSLKAFCEEDEEQKLVLAHQVAIATALQVSVEKLSQNGLGFTRSLDMHQEVVHEGIGIGEGKKAWSHYECLLELHDCLDEMKRRLPIGARSTSGAVGCVRAPPSPRDANVRDAEQKDSEEVCFPRRRYVMRELSNVYSMLRAVSCEADGRPPMRDLKEPMQERLLEEASPPCRLRFVEVSQHCHHQTQERDLVGPQVRRRLWVVESPPVAVSVLNERAGESCASHLMDHMEAANVEGGASVRLPLIVDLPSRRDF
uniref:Uncharacterized protein n=1 Tax=Trypanosoma vivax (strain Y486) TaxID=1055687 RepID=G0U134_TRYVY|nr:hypothetical protein TVY486_0803970 [Trypanosoma vivax Y486]